MVQIDAGEPRGSDESVEGAESIIPITAVYTERDEREFRGTQRYGLPDDSGMHLEGSLIALMAYTAPHDREYAKYAIPH